MDLAPLFDAGWVIALHASTALMSLLLGLFIFVRPKGTLVHRTMGYTWIAAMVTVVVSSLFIHVSRMLGPFGPIHLLSIWVAICLFIGWRSARTHRVRAHRIWFIGTWVGALGINFWFTFLPGRIMHEVVFG